jgi:hypothetical protein
MTTKPLPKHDNSKLNTTTTKAKKLTWKQQAKLDRAKLREKKIIWIGSIPASLGIKQMKRNGASASTMQIYKKNVWDTILENRFLALQQQQSNVDKHMGEVHGHVS